MIKKLPIRVDSTIQTECWTYYKLAIIEAFVEGRKWLTTHVSMYVDGTGKAWFGNSENTIYGMQYFSDILKFEKQDFWGINESNIVSDIISKIESNKYVVLYIFSPPNFKTPHECFIYGYDNIQQAFYTTAISDNGLFIESQLYFEDLKKGFYDIKEWYRKEQDLLERNSFWFHLYTTISFDFTYISNNCTFDIIQKLLKDISGKGYSELDLFKEEEGYSNHNIYYGLSSIIGIKELITATIDSKQFIQGDFFIDITNRIIQSLRKLYEYLTLIYHSLVYVSSLCDDVYLNVKYITDKHREYCLHIKELYLMAIKFRKKMDWNILKKIQSNIDTLYDSIRTNLLDFCHTI